MGNFTSFNLLKIEEDDIPKYLATELTFKVWLSMFIARKLSRVVIRQCFGNKVKFSKKCFPQQSQ